MNSYSIATSARIFSVSLGIFVLSLAPTQAVVGTFEGPLSLIGGDHPVGAVVTQPGTSTFGAWSGLIQGIASIDTTQAPNGVMLSATPPQFDFVGSFGNTPQNVRPGVSVAQLEIPSAAANGSFSFQYELSFGTQLEVFHGIHGSPGFVLQTLTSGSSVVIPFSAGEAFGFRVIADGLTSGPLTAGRGVASLAAQGQQGAFVFNPILTVPETSTVMGGAVVLGLASASVIRKFRR